MIAVAEDRYVRRAALGTCPHCSGPNVAQLATDYACADCGYVLSADEQAALPTCLRSAAHEGALVTADPTARQR